MAPRTKLSVKLALVSCSLAGGTGVLLSAALDTFDTSSILRVLLSLVLASTGCLALAVSLVVWYVSSCNPADSQTWQSLRLHVLMDIATFKARHALETLAEKARDCQRHQEQVLLSIVQHHRSTDYGRDHHFEDVHSTEDFVRTHPLTTYDHYKTYIDQTIAGEENVMVRDPVVYFGITSGTTGRTKVFPITANCDSSSLAPLVMCLKKNRARGSRSYGRQHALRIKPKMKKSPTGINIGFLSYRIAPYLPIYLSPQAAWEIEDEASSLYVHALFGLAERYVISIDGILSPLVFAFFRIIENSWSDLCQDIERGTLKPGLNIPTEIRRELEENLKPDPARAEELRAEFRRGFDGIAKRVWADLKEIQMLTTGIFEAYTKLLRKSYIKNVTVLSIGHGATEGTVGLCLSDDVNSTKYTILPSSGTFFEFIEESDIHKDNPRVLLMEQVEKGKRYEVVITNRCGLYRYRLGDVIKVVGFFHQCPTYEFEYRVGQMLNVAWEKTPENVFYKAISEAAAEFPDGVELVDYTAMEGSVWEEATGEKKEKQYVLVVELAQEGTAYRLSESQKELFDVKLRMQFEVYDILRENGSIASMDVEQVPPGSFLALKYHMNKDTCNQQFKMPRVLRNLEFVKMLQGFRGE